MGSIMIYPATWGNLQCLTKHVKREAVSTSCPSKQRCACFVEYISIDQDTISPYHHTLTLREKDISLRIRNQCYCKSLLAQCPRHLTAFIAWTPLQHNA